MNNSLSLLATLGAIFIGFGIVVAIILGIILAAKKLNENRCRNCGCDIKEDNLFCPWCHCDLRGGGKG